ncbi:MAG: POTRA domain-containing protein [Bdellovibrionota bacterium]|nr:MAG: POTRA domain-containing protein [Bdellovibrionota bacterium]
MITCSSVLSAEPKKSSKIDPYKEFNGRIVRNVNVEVREIFEGAELASFYRAANALKVSTRDDVIRREVLLKPGDKFDSFLLRETERELRLLGFIRQANVTAFPVEGTDQVDLVVSVQDTWTIIPQLGFSSGTGNDKITAGMAESNLMGFGKRLEALYEEDEDSSGLEMVWDDRRVLGTPAQFISGVFLKDDGDEVTSYLGVPFRTLPQKTSWSLDTDWFDGINRLYEAGDERFVYRRESVDLTGRYAFASGDPESSLYRYSFGYSYHDDNFEEATEDDFEDINVDPDSVSRDPALLAADRRFTGPLFGIQHIKPNFISRRYVDRFDRLEDYNLGVENSLSALIAPRGLGSSEDALIVNGALLRGRELGGYSFGRAELSGATRVEDDGLANSFIHGRLLYFRPFDPWFAGGWFLGRHTLAANLSIDYGIDLDKDQELYIGGDNVLRGYESRAFNGDKRYALNLEDRVHLYENLFDIVSLGAAAFIDVGAATHDSFGEMFTDRTFADFGAGFRINFPKSSGARVLRIDIAFPMRDGPEGSGTMEPRLLFSGGQLFGARLRSESLGPAKESLGVGLKP